MECTLHRYMYISLIVQGAIFDILAHCVKKGGGKNDKENINTKMGCSIRSSALIFAAHISISKSQPQLFIVKICLLPCLICQIKTLGISPKQ